MDKFANFILTKRKIIFTILTIAAGICAFLMMQVVVNTDMTQYMPEDSRFRAGLQVMADEFGEVNTPVLHVMFEGLDSEAEQPYVVMQQLELFVGVAEISRLIHDYDEGQTLFFLTLEAGLSAMEQRNLVATITDTFSDHNIEMSGPVAGVDIELHMHLILIPTVIILTIILLLMCSSWVEPLLLFANIGIAILLNMGTNIIFDSISDITQMIAALLQVALSMDYSIIFLNRYRQEKAAMEVEDHYLAMKNTIRNSFSTISGISFTTIVGMMMLVFMSFTIGADLGLVIAKGVFASLICVFGVMPALILWFDKWIDKTTKPTLNIKMGAVGRFAYKARYVVLGLFAVLFIGASFLQSGLEITYSEVDYDPVHQVFDLDNTFVILYQNEDEANFASVIDWIEWGRQAHSGWGGVAHVDQIIDIYSYGTLFTAELTAEELADTFEMDELMIGLIFRNYLNHALPTVTLGNFLDFMRIEVANSPLFAGVMPPEDLGQLEQLPLMLEHQVMTTELDAEGLSWMLQMQFEMVEQLLMLHGMLQGGAPTETIALDEFIAFFQVQATTNPMFMTEVSAEELAMLAMLPQIAVGEILDAESSPSELAETLQMDESMVTQLLYMYDFIHGDELETTKTLVDFLDYLITDFAQIPMFAASFTPEMIAELEDARYELAGAADMFVAANFSRAMINTSFDFEGEEVFAFIDDLLFHLEDALDGEFYILGTSVMPHEMSQSFPSEYSFITILTVIAFFIVGAISFKSISVSALLAITIQAAVFITMGVTYFMDGGIMFLPLIIAQVLLKSRVIDYGILYTANYVEARREHGVKDAIVTALNNSIDTVLTSGLIIVVVCFVVGLVFRGVNVAISEILLLIAQGCFIGVMLSIFVLPSLVAVFDRFVIRAKAKIH